MNTPEAPVWTGSIGGWVLNGEPLIPHSVYYEMKGKLEDAEAALKKRDQEFAKLQAASLLLEGSMKAAESKIARLEKREAALAKLREFGTPPTTVLAGPDTLTVVRQENERMSRAIKSWLKEEQDWIADKTSDQAKFDKIAAECKPYQDMFRSEEDSGPGLADSIMEIINE